MADKDLQKTTKKVVKKPASKTLKKPASKAASKSVKVKELRVTQADMAYIIGVTAPNVLGLTQSGTLTRGDDGLYDLVSNVSGYCRSLRERKSGGAATGSKAELEVQNLALKNEKLKEGLRSWRMQRDREVAMAILDAQRNAMNQLREECKLVPQLVSVIDGMLSCISRIDVEDISYRVEGEEEDDDEE